MESNIVVAIALRFGYPVGSALASLEPHQQLAIERALDDLDEPPEPTGALVPRPGGPGPKQAQQSLPLPSDPSS